MSNRKKLRAVIEKKIAQKTPLGVEISDMYGRCDADDERDFVDMYQCVEDSFESWPECKNLIKESNLMLIEVGFYTPKPPNSVRHTHSFGKKRKDEKLMKDGIEYWESTHFEGWLEE